MKGMISNASIRLSMARLNYAAKLVGLIFAPSHLVTGLIPCGVTRLVRAVAVSYRSNFGDICCSNFGRAVSQIHKVYEIAYLRSALPS